MGIAKATLIFVFTAVCMVGSFMAADPVSAQTDTVEVQIQNFAFDPTPVMITVGTTVLWTNLDVAPHTSTSDDGFWDSGVLTTGQSFAFTFTTVGEFGYFCGVHPAMQGVVQVSSITDTPEEDEQNLPEDFWLGANYPNPFNPVTTIEYSLPTQSHVLVEVFNIVGNKVQTLVDETQSAGIHSTSWDGNDLNGQPVASGIYFYRLQAGEFSQTRRMLLLK